MINRLIAIDNSKALDEVNATWKHKLPVSRPFWEFLYQFLVVDLITCVIVSSAANALVRMSFFVPFLLSSSVFTLPGTLDQYKGLKLTLYISYCFQCTTSSLMMSTLMDETSE